MGVAGRAELISLVDDFRLAGESIEKTAADVVRKVAEQTKANAQSLAPRKTGNLAGSITITYRTTTEAIVKPTAIYGVFQEFGTGTRGEFRGTAYTIKPKTKPALTFKTKDGKWVTVREVNHPGIPPRPFMRPALEQALSSYQEELTRQGALLITKGSNA